MLERRTPLQRGTKQLRRFQRLKQVSDKRRKASYKYAAKRRTFLAARPICEVCQNAKSVDVHHTKGRRGPNYLDEKTWLATCRPCHDEIHRRPSIARAAGLLA